MVLVSDEKKIDNTELFSLLQSSTYIESGPFHTVLPVRRPGVHKKMESNTAGAADPRDIPDHVASCSAL